MWYSEHYLEDTSQQVDIGFSAWMKCDNLNIVWKIFQSCWTVILQLDEVWYSEQFLEDTSQLVDSVIAAWTKCVTVNLIWELLHNRWTVVLQLEWCVIQWTLSGRYITACGQWFCSLNELWYSEHFLENISQHVDSGFSAWMECVRVNIMWKIIHRMSTVLLQLD